MNAASVNSTPRTESSLRCHIGNVRSVFQISGRDNARKNRNEYRLTLNVGVNTQVSVTSAFGFDFGDKVFGNANIVERVAHVLPHSPSLAQPEQSRLRNFVESFRYRNAQHLKVDSNPPLLPAVNCDSANAGASFIQSVYADNSINADSKSNAEGIIANDANAAASNSVAFIFNFQSVQDS